MQVKLITNRELYEEVIEPVAKARRFVWIGTADIKDLHVKYKGRVVSFLFFLNELTKRGVEIRLLHAKEPGTNFRSSFDKYPGLWDAMERQLCPRVHFKHMIIDGRLAYTGSANLTGAGLGMKSPDRRNFEAGIVTAEPELVEKIMAQFDEVWMGRFCRSCGRKAYCSDPIVGGK